MKTKFFLLAIALMFCAIPMFAQGGAGRRRRQQPLGPGHGGFLDGDRFGPLRARSGQGRCGSVRRHRAQPGRVSGHPVRADFRSGADRIPRALHVRDYLHQSQLIECYLALNCSSG